MLFHIIERAAWQTAQNVGVYRAPSLETAGFIHLSHKSQVVWVANQFYRGQTDLLLLMIDPARLPATLRYDVVPGHGTFPHLYGALDLNAVAQVWEFLPQANGEFVLPPECVKH
jgi:uncharacterized protein (DUF952 family)